MSLAFIDVVSIQHAYSAQAASSALQLSSIQSNPAGTVAVAVCSVKAMGCQAALPGFRFRLCSFSLCGLGRCSVFLCIKWRAQ